jgi:hypothetical protein
MPDVTFSVDFTAPGVLGNLTAAGHSYAGDFTNQPSGVDLTWLPVNTSPENVQAIELWMIDSHEARKIASFTDPSIVTYTYPFPRAGETIEYRIYQRVLVGGQSQIGLWGSDTFGTDMNYISLVSVANPTVRRVVSRGMSAMSTTLLQEQQFQVPAGGADYKELSGSIRGRSISVTLDFDDAIRSADGVTLTAKEQRAAFEAMFDSFDTLCARNGDGEKYFGKIEGNPTFSRKYGRGAWTVPFTLRRTSYSEGPTS